jgi:tetratricopeptide (TPR) repeat protein
MSDALRYTRIAAAFLGRGDFARAAIAATHATEQDGNVADAWLVRGIAAAKLLRHSDAAPCFIRAIELRPNDLDAWTDLGEVYLALGRYDAAAAAFKHVMERDPKALHPSGRRARAVTGRTYALLKKAS